MTNKNNFTNFNSNGKKQPENDFNKYSGSNEKVGNYKLPADTRKLVENQVDIIDNYALRFNKVSFFDSEDKKFKFFEASKGKKPINIRPNFSGINISAILERQKDSFKNSDLKVEQGNYKIDWKLAVGLGNESVYETSITLHQIYGIPYIPGSTLKGVVRSHIIAEKFGKVKGGDLDLKKAEARALKDQGFCDIFGCPQKNSIYKESREGKIIFFDAFPTSKPKIQTDIMNPHFGSYYSDNSNTVPPADYFDPKPVFFLTVKDTEFRFTIGVKEADNKTIQEGIFKEKMLLSIAYEWMNKALKEHGIGAKTSVGYGYFRNT